MCISKGHPPISFRLAEWQLISSGLRVCFVCLLGGLYLTSSELSFSRKTIFMNVATELIDEDHPPPATMLRPIEQEQNIFWPLRNCRSFVPFRVNLPHNVGPGPFQSRRAKIRYVIYGYGCMNLIE